MPDPDEAFWKSCKRRYASFLKSASHRPSKICKSIPPEQREAVFKSLRRVTVRLRDRFDD